jgi:hypothetical protein
MTESRMTVSSAAAWRALPQVAALLSTAALLLMMPAACQAFSVLAHQAVVDQAWDGTLVPALRKRFPNATQQELEDVRGYARAGSHLPDLGYFPFGSHLFTDLPITKEISAADGLCGSSKPEATTKRRLRSPTRTRASSGRC